MLKLYTKQYRSNYEGEDIIQERRLEHGEWTSVEETVPNNVVNNQVSNRAVVFGNGESRKKFPVSHTLNKFNGLLGADTLQSYACNAFYRDHTPDFLVVTTMEMAQECVDSGFTTANIVYAQAPLTLEFPGAFYLTPHDLYADAGATATYLACFDGHKKIYLVGCEGQFDSGYNSNIYAGTNGYDAIGVDQTGNNWEESYSQLFAVYDDVDFALVTPNGRYPTHASWRGYANFRQISHRDMVLEADL